jgi:hypothetical protein
MTDRMLGMRKQMRVVVDIQQDQLPLDGLTTSAERHDRGSNKGVMEEIGGDGQQRLKAG